jgi:hypoxanthine phosphoribosyltransferase
MARATRQAARSTDGVYTPPGNGPDPGAGDPQTSLPPPPRVSDAAGPPRPKRYRGSRGGRRHRRPGKTAPPPVQEQAPVVEEKKPEKERRPARSRRAREPDAGKPETAGKKQTARPAAGGRSSGGALRSAEPAAAVASKEKPRAQRRGRPKAGLGGAAQEPPRQQGRRRRPKDVEPAPQIIEPRAGVPVARAAVRPRTRIPVTGAPTESVPEPFAHNAEYEFARLLDFYAIDWQYEPRTFPLRWERGHVTEAFTPDFYLPDLNLYVELTTLKQGLTAEKNRKMRLLREMYPGINVMLLKKQDYLRLLAKYGYGPLSPDQVPDIDRVLAPATKIQKRVAELGARISRDYAGKEPVLVGVLRGVICFMADLMRHISVPISIDLMSISSYEGNGTAAVRILKDLDSNIKGRDVILVEDIVDTGMTLNHIIEYLNTKRPASIKVCTLLDKRVRRIANVPVDYAGFEIPDEFVVGYGLDFRQQFRNLPFLAVLKHELLP